MRSTNPVFKEDTFSGLRSASENAMTVRGTVEKTAGLLFLVFCSAAYTWTATRSDGFSAALPWVIGGMIAGIILALVTVFKTEWAPVTAPMYALAEGLLVGGLSAMFEAKYSGIVLNASMLTLGTLAVMLVTYRTGLLRATDGFRRGVVAATGAIFLVYLVGFIMSLFGRQILYIHESGWIGIGFSLFVVGIAALNFILDFDLIEKGAEAGAPRHMEWYGAFGILVTLIWLYIEMLRLLSKLRSR